MVVSKLLHCCLGEGKTKTHLLLIIAFSAPKMSSVQTAQVTITLLASKAGPTLVFDFRSGACFWSKCPDHLHLLCFSSSKWTYLQLKPASKMHSRSALAANGYKARRTQSSVCMKQNRWSKYTGWWVLWPCSISLGSTTCAFRASPQNLEKGYEPRLFWGTLYSHYKDILNPQMSPVLSAW